jgi:hypothetical protein
MNFNNYLLAGFNILSNTTITISGFPPIDAIFDNIALSHEKQFNFVEDFESPVIVRTQDLPVSKKSVIGKTVVLALDSNIYRIDRMKVGAATTFLYFSSKEKS